MPLQLPDHLVKQAADAAKSDVVRAARGGSEIALSLVAKWLASQYPAVHQAYLQEFNR